MSQIIDFLNLNFWSLWFLFYQTPHSKMQTVLNYLSDCLLPSELNLSSLACRTWEILPATCSLKLISSSPGYTAGVHCPAILAVRCDHMTEFLHNRSKRKWCVLFPTWSIKVSHATPPCCLFPSLPLDAEGSLQGTGDLRNGRGTKWKKYGFLD